MKRLTSSLVLLLVVLGSPGLVAQELSPPPLGSEIVIEPDPSGDGYLCRSELRDLETEELLAAPVLRFRAGEPASVRSELPSGVTYELEVEVDAAGESARWSSQLRMGEKTVGQQSGVVRLSG